MNVPELKEYLSSTQVWQFMQETGLDQNTDAFSDWEWTLSPLRKGKDARHFTRKLMHRIARQVAAQHAFAARNEIPPVESGRELWLGDVAVDHRLAEKHVLISGMTGSGKTLATHSLVEQKCAIDPSHRVEWVDNKGSEGRRLRGAKVFSPQLMPWNMLHPMGPSEQFYFTFAAELGKAFNLRPETWTEVAEVLLRIEQGLQPGDPYPSLTDFAQTLILLSVTGGEAKLRTAAHAIRVLCSVLGKSARIRHTPGWEHYPRVALDFAALPLRIHMFLSAMVLLRSQRQIVVQGHPQSRVIRVSDEAVFEYGKEASQPAGSGYISPAKRFITQMRSFGQWLIACVQMLSETDECVIANSALKIFMAAASIQEAKLAQQLGNLTDAETAELLRFRPGEAFVFAEGFRKAVRTRFPLVEVGPYPSDDEMAARQAPDMAWLEAHTVYAPEEERAPLRYLELLGERVEATPEPAPAPQFPSEDIGAQLLDELRALLCEIQNHPTAGTTEHYDNLGWSRARASRVKQEAEELGLIAVRVEPSRDGGPRGTNGRPREILSLTPLGEKLLEDA